MCYTSFGVFSEKWLVRRLFAAYQLLQFHQKCDYTIHHFHSTPYKVSSFIFSGWLGDVTGSFYLMLCPKGAIHVRAGECQFAAISYRLRFGCWYFDMLDRMCNQPIEIGFHFQ